MSKYYLLTARLARNVSNNGCSRKNGGCWTAWIPKNATQSAEKVFFGTIIIHPGLVLQSHMDIVTKCAGYAR